MTITERLRRLLAARESHAELLAEMHVSQEALADSILRELSDLTGDRHQYPLIGDDPVRVGVGEYDVVLLPSDTDARIIVEYVPRLDEPEPKNPAPIPPTNGRRSMDDVIPPVSFRGTKP